MAKLYIIRHAIAGDREEFRLQTGRPDDERPLTDEGRKKMKKISRLFRKLTPSVDVFLQSPLVRSQQTVDVLLKDFPESHVSTVTSLRPGAGFDQLIKDINEQAAGSVAIVGHESHLSEFVFYLMTGHKGKPTLAFKKGGIACFDFNQSLRPRRAHMEWLVTPKVFLAKP